MSSISLDQEKTELIKKIRRIELKISKIVDSTLSGEHHSLFKGQGIEFDEVREYSAGDDVKSIDWNVTGRMNFPYVKRFHEERELLFSILFDNSSSNQFGSVHQTKKEMASEIAAALAFSIIKNRDKVGFLSFSDRIEHYLPPGKGNGHGFKIISESLFHKAQSKMTDLSQALNYISRVQPKRSVIFIISDFLYPINFERIIKTISRKNKIFAIQLQDPLEVNLEHLGLVDLINNETGESVLVDTSSKKFRKSYREFITNHLEQLNKIFMKNKIKSININTDSDYLKTITNFLRK